MVVSFLIAFFLLYMLSLAYRSSTFDLIGEFARAHVTGEMAGNVSRASGTDKSIAHSLLFNIFIFYVSQTKNQRIWIFLVCNLFSFSGFQSRKTSIHLTLKGWLLINCLVDFWLQDLMKNPALAGTNRACVAEFHLINPLPILHRSCVNTKSFISAADLTLNPTIELWKNWVLAMSMVLQTAITLFGRLLMAWGIGLLARLHHFCMLSSLTESYLSILELTWLMSSASRFQIHHGYCPWIFLSVINSTACDQEMVRVMGSC